MVKGLLTSGRQINVQRTANKAVRRVQGHRRQATSACSTTTARATRCASRSSPCCCRWSATARSCPSTDGKDPAFKVDVYSTQADFANGIVRIDIAVRPVRAIDYVYATILVRTDPPKELSHAADLHRRSHPK